MSDVALRAVLSGFEEAKAQLEGVAKGIDKVAESEKKMSQSSPTAAKGLGDVAKGAGEASESMEGLAKVAGIAAGLLATGVAAAATYAAKQFFESIQTVRDLGDELHNMSQITGFSVEKLGGLQLVAATNNISLQQLSSGIASFNKRIDDASKGSGEAYEAFKRLDISIKDQHGSLKTSDVLFAEVAERFRGMENGASKTAISIALFDRAGKALIPTLNEGADGFRRLEEEARKAGIVLSGETAEAANKLNANMAVLRAYGQGFWIEVASPIVEGLARMTTAMREARREGAGLIPSILRGLEAKSPEDIVKEQETIIASIKRLEDAKASAGRGQWSGIHQTQLDALYQGLQRSYHDMGVLDGSGMEGPQQITPPPAPPGKSNASAQREADREAHTRAEAAVRLEEETARDFREAWDWYYKYKEKERIKEERDSEASAVAEATADAMALKDRQEAWAIYYAYREKEERRLSSIFGSKEFSVDGLFSGLHAGLTNAFKDVLTGGSVGDAFKNFFSSLPSMFLGEFARMMSRAVLEPIMKPVGEVIKEIMNPAGEWFAKLIKEGWESMKGMDWGDIFSGLTSFFGNVLTSFGEMLGVSVDGVGSMFSSLGGSGGGMFGGGGGFGAMAGGILGNVFGGGPIGGMIGGALGGMLDGLFASGTDMMVSEPTLFVAGEAGSERVTVSPVGAAHRSSGGGATLIVNGPFIGDYYTTRKFIRDMERMGG